MNDFYNHIYRDLIAAPDIARADAFVVGFTIPLFEVYQRYQNHSVNVANAARYDYMIQS